ncbi:MAG: hypothetical protein HYX96_08505 [Chloroflexi bacterium]|nr:hypothetical protein [Chloroflexota bacterium]
MRKIRIVSGLLLALVALLVLAAPALAHGHSHVLDTPGADPILAACPEMAHEAVHNFHSNIHLGTPGTFAFDQTGNPVDVSPVACQ